MRSKKKPGSKEKKLQCPFVDTILLVNVENVDIFQGKIMERESHEMKLPSWQSKA